DRTLLRAGRLRLLLEERLEAREDLLGGGGDVLELTRGELPVVADRRIADELADLLRVLRRALPDEVGEHLAGEVARFLQRRRRPRSRSKRRSRGPSRARAVRCRAGSRSGWVRP